MNAAENAAIYRLSVHSMGGNKCQSYESNGNFAQARNGPFE
jgi:hypothetical protein